MLVLLKNNLTSEILFRKEVDGLIEDADDLAREVLSVHLVEFDEIGFIDSDSSRIYSIRHIDGSYAPLEVEVVK